MRLRIPSRRDPDSLFLLPSTGEDISLSVSQVLSCRNFCNKMWQTLRFTLGVLGDNTTPVTTLEEVQQRTRPSDCMDFNGEKGQACLYVNNKISIIKLRNFKPKPTNTGQVRAAHLTQINSFKCPVTADGGGEDLHE